MQLARLTPIGCQCHIVPGTVVPMHAPLNVFKLGQLIPLFFVEE